VPTFETPLPSQLILIAYDEPASNNSKYCLPELKDYENDIPIIDGVHF